MDSRIESSRQQSEATWPARGLFQTLTQSKALGDGGEASVLAVAPRDKLELQSMNEHHYEGGKTSLTLTLTPISPDDPLGTSPTHEESRRASSK